MSTACSQARYAHVIGDPVAHSRSPHIHRFWLERLGIAGGYSAHRVKMGELADYLASFRIDADWLGCNVTMPHKQAVIPLLDAVDPVAKAVGAVNTVIRQRDGRLKGYNTDVAGFLEPLTSELAKAHLFRMARILGTGGAARAVMAGLAQNGVVLVLAGRNVNKAKQLIADLAPQGQHHAVSLSHFADPTDFPFDDRKNCLDIIVNASPLGMRGQPELDFDFSHAPPGSIVYDIVTDPVETRFLKNARAAGFQTVDGYAMLIGQAAAAFTYFFGERPPRHHDAELRDRLLS
ncbi:shikimate dehydrogenase [Pontixanthobacter sp.]|uniref:shikimate dehydrogenase n=1 Tax=Pontixanthobacter sp. TaxID=2792078 RepID=UPI003C7D2BF7